MRIEDRVLELAPEQGARIVALGLLAEAREAAQAFAAGEGEEPLHDFRVSVRRLRSALRTYRPWLAGPVRRRHEKRLKKVGRSTNAARDAEVQLAWLADAGEELAAPRLRVGLDLLVARCEAHVGLDPARTSKRFRRAARTLEARLRRSEARRGGGDGGTFAAVLASLVEEQARALSARLGAIRGAADRERVHRARIEGKRLRYLLEPLRGLPRADASAAVRRLKRLQDVLGSLHDAHVLAGELRDALVDAAAQRARELHDAVYGRGRDAAALRAELRASARPGLLAVLRLVRERRDALYAELDRDWRPGGMDALAREARALAAALGAHAGAAPSAAPPPP